MDKDEDKEKTCCRCQKAGALHQCARCRDAFHRQCINLPIDEILSGYWNCSECKLILAERKRSKSLGEFLPEELKNETVCTASDYRYIREDEMDCSPDEVPIYRADGEENDISETSNEQDLTDTSNSDYDEISSSSEGYHTVVSSDESIIINGREYMSKNHLVSKFNQINVLSVFDPASALYNDFVKMCYRHYNAISNHDYTPFYCMLSINSISNGKLILTVFSSRTHDPRYIAQMVPLKIMTDINLELIVDMEERLNTPQLGDFIKKKAEQATNIYNAR